MEAIERESGSGAALWTGRVMSGIVILFMIFDAGIKLIPIQPVIDTMAELGYPSTAALARGIGIVEIVSIVLYGWSRTSVLGAILLTGVFGGAIAAHLRVESPVFTHLLFGLYLGLLAWGGLYLRDPRVRAMIPFRV
ncbi:DoxX family protein [Mesorhizobium sp. BAC0120]|uniref:DoxX family protein n=1 Tax=Mesorhizobium sp. BAC0120 TaxID=3090670 RepID=UPI00298D398C|nr:DoxX family protein [Mesorhizobium sp. BAC0120]MDW6025230.1 DoxX family protein [Mesorhizobium sp. BAC0120]